MKPGAAPDTVVFGDVQLASTGPELVMSMALAPVRTRCYAWGRSLDAVVPVLPRVRVRVCLCVRERGGGIAVASRTALCVLSRCA